MSQVYSQTTNCKKYKQNTHRCVTPSSILDGDGVGALR